MKFKGCLMTNDDERQKELDQKYQAFLQREKAKEESQSGLAEALERVQKEREQQKYNDLLKPQAKDVLIPLTDEAAPITPKVADELTKRIQETAKHNLITAYCTDLQIAKVHDKEIDTNTKLRYAFTLDFMQRHWRAVIACGLKLKDLLNV